MAYYTMHNSIVLVLTIIHFSSYTLGSWLKPPYDDPPPTPGNDERKSCFGWINYYEFVDDVSDNRELARTRAKQYDKDVATYAVIYAHILLAFPTYANGPSIHCFHYFSHSIYGLFRKFELSLYSCADWIYQYRFKFEGYHRINWLHAQFLDPNEDGAISAFAAGYARFLQKIENPMDSISITEYCSGISLDDYKPWPFISFNETTKTCKEWIHLSEYGDEVNDNLNKYRNQEIDFMDYINIWTRLYIEHLFAFDIKSPGNDILFTPTEFCNRNGWNDNVPLTYFDLQFDPTNTDIH